MREPKIVMPSGVHTLEEASRLPPHLSDARHTCCFQIEARGFGLVDSMLPVLVWPLLEAAQTPR